MLASAAAKLYAYLRLSIRTPSPLLCLQEIPRSHHNDGCARHHTGKLPEPKPPQKVLRAVTWGMTTFRGRSSVNFRQPVLLRGGHWVHSASFQGHLARCSPTLDAEVDSGKSALIETPPRGLGLSLPVCHRFISQPQDIELRSTSSASAQ